MFKIASFKKQLVFLTLALLCLAAVVVAKKVFGLLPTIGVFKILFAFFIIASLIFKPISKYLFIFAFLFLLVCPIAIFLNMQLYAERSAEIFVLLSVIGLIARLIELGRDLQKLSFSNLFAYNPLAKSKYPTISIIIPTLNAAKTLNECLKRVREQDYPKNKLEIIIADGGSTDKTIAIAKKYGAKIVANKLRTGEAGKAIGLKNAKNEIIALIDSDNYLPSNDWLKRMVEPFSDPRIIGSEPIAYTYRENDGYITRYCALIGMNDPICLYLGNYDRINYLTNRWTGMDVKSEDRGNYLKVTLERYKVPTIGANGTMIRKKLIIKQVGDYLFDIDEIYELMSKGHDQFAKVKIGIIHIFSGSIGTFVKKQRRRIEDYMYYQKKARRKYPWNKLNKLGLIKFAVFSTLLLPSLYHGFIGYIKKPDKAWFFHPIACWLTFWVYLLSYSKVILRGTRAMDRKGWRQ